MKNFFQYVLLLVFTVILSSPVKGQDIERIKVPELEKILNNPADKLYVVNFWATWCAPCIKEFPVFEKVAKDYNNGKVEFIMISLDFPSQIEKQLLPFLKKNNVSLRVAVMTDVDYNAWIDKVEPSWQGDIPATLIFNNAEKSRKFHSGEMNESELREMINTNL